MNIIFFGTSDFAASILEALLSSKHKVTGVVTAADKKKGRGQKIGFSPVKIIAQKRNLALFQPADLRDAKFVKSLKNKTADLFVVCAYGKILTKEILQIPGHYAINLHPSLLPKYRGAAPIEWAIIKGEKETGITVFKMDEHMDRGDIILQKKTDISFSDTAVSLAEKLARTGGEVLIQAIDLIECKKVIFTKQKQSLVSLAPKLKKADGLIDWRSSALEIYNRIRGLQPWPCAFTYLENKLLKIWQAKVVPAPKDGEPSEILKVDKNGILVQTGKAKLMIITLQLEGKRKMSAAEFILGHKVETGQRLGRR